MGKNAKTPPAPVDTSKGTAAYKLLVQYKADVEPRLPAGTLADLVADLTLLGANPSPAPPSPSPSPGPPPPPPPTLAEAMAGAIDLISGIHEAIQGAHAKADVRKAYG